MQEKILIVDDQDIDRIILCDIVKSFFSKDEIYEAKSGKEALEFLDKITPSIILLDWLLPDIEGIEILKKIRCNNNCDDLPVIMVTSISDVYSLKKAFEFGVNDYVCKPVIPEELCCRVKTSLRIKEYVRTLKKQNEELEILSLVAKYTNNSVILIDKNGNLEWANQAFYNFYGLALDEFKKKYGNTIFEVSKNSSIKEYIDNCYTKKIPVTYITFWETQDGQKKWIQTTLSPVFDENNEIKKIIAVETDITQLKEYENELIQQREDLQTLNENLMNAYILLEQKNS